MTKAVKIRVAGKVQGVWFRKSAKEQAGRLAVVGFVRNERDGSVYIEAEGDKTLVDNLIEWCGIGPTKSEVKEVIVQETQPKGYTDFTIRY